MYEDDNDNVSKATDSGDARGSEYRFSGPFYQDIYSSQGNDSSSGNSYSGSYRQTGEVNPPKKNGKFGRLIAKTVCIALIFGVVASTSFLGSNYLGKMILGDAVGVNTSTKTSETVAETETVTQNAGDGSAVQTVTDVSAIVENSMPSVVAITNISVKEVQSYWGFGTTPQEQEQESTGTGIIIGQNDTELLIVTNNHVIADATTLTIVFSVDEGDEDATAVSAQIKGTDSEKDLGVIAVQLSDIPEDILSAIKVATIGDSSALKVGEPVIAIGNALGYGQSVTTGIVSALNREVTLQNEDGTSITNTLIQTDAAINPGNSGGALLNMNGEIIGINEAKFSSTGVEGMGYAIPISDVESIIGELTSRETRAAVDAEKAGFLGIACQDVTADVSEQYDMPVGVYVSSVTEGSGAEKAGIKKGDIITAFDGISISTYTELKSQLQYYAAGETLEVTIQSPEGAEYVEKTVSVTLSSKAEAGITE